METPKGFTVTFTYEPDKEKMLQALRTVLLWTEPSKKLGGIKS